MMPEKADQIQNSSSKLIVKRLTGGLKLLIILFLVCGFLCLRISFMTLRAETTMTFQEHLSMYGYPFEEYSLTTLDGYILSLYRIPGTGKDPHNLKPPILLIHGLSNSANSFIINLCAKAPAFILADENYDVWLANLRGSHLSRGHTKYNAAVDPEYWDFAFPEILEYDMPTMIKFIKQHTNYSKISLLGHSQGASAIIWYLAHNKDSKDDISLGISLGSPGSYIRSKSVYAYLLTSPFYHYFCKILGIHVISDLTDDVFTAKFGAAFPRLIAWISKDLYDVDLHGDNPENLYVYVYRIRGGTSLKNLLFWRQVQKDLRRKPYLYEMNPEKNKSHTPQIVDFNNISVPIALFGGSYDNAALGEDIEILRQDIKPQYLVHFKTDYHQDHGGFIISCNMTYFSDVIALLEKYAD
jgi:pimeloyl-ACP methyl ester carboxylesterase